MTPVPNPEDESDPDISSLTLSAASEAGPFWDGGVFISDDFEELRDWVGMTRSTYELAMAWHEEAMRFEPNLRELETIRLEILQKLQEEVRPGIVVEIGTPLTARDIDLMSVRIAADGFFRDAHQETLLTPEQVDSLGADFPRELAAWQTRGDSADISNAPIEHFAWEDAGAAIARRIQTLTSPGVRIVVR